MSADRVLFLVVTSIVSAVRVLFLVVVSIVSAVRVPFYVVASIVSADKVSFSVVPSIVMADRVLFPVVASIVSADRVLNPIAEASCRPTKCFMTLKIDNLLRLPSFRCMIITDSPFESCLPTNVRRQASKNIYDLLISSFFDSFDVENGQVILENDYFVSISFAISKKCYIFAEKT